MGPHFREILLACTNWAVATLPFEHARILRGYFLSSTRPMSFRFQSMWGF